MDLLCAVDPSVVESVALVLVLVELFGPELAEEEGVGLPVLGWEGGGEGFLEEEVTWSPVSAEWSHSFGWISLRISMGLLCISYRSLLSD